MYENKHQFCKRVRPIIGWLKKKAWNRIGYRRKKVGKVIRKTIINTRF